ncbi:DUF5908 family protein [Aquimarina algicola]|uniref:DUF5908 family protein n=1 Tax=Aquimarina algicola TaxID=2589995 RepID=UPI001CF5C8F5|nr:DUF5908 family protein [Aquimarina algicola]
MPLEIRELIIKTTVNNTGNSNAGGAGGAQGGKAKEANINEIAERVFEILKEKSER